MHRNHYFCPHKPSKEKAMLIIFLILIVSVIFFMSGKVRSDLVAICALLALLIFHILTPEEALSGFSNSVVIMMVGLFVVGGGIFQTGLAKMIPALLISNACHIGHRCIRQ